MPKNWSGRFIEIPAIALAALVFFGCAAKRPQGLDAKPWPSFLADEARSNASADRITLPLVISWKKDISDFRVFNVYPKEQLSSPVISNGALYVGSTNESFYSMDLYSGKVLWKYDAGYPIEAPPSVSASHTCFGASNGILRCFDTATGKKLWSFQAKSEILSSPLIIGDRIYFSSSDDRVYALSLRSGEKAWIYNRGTFQTVAPRLGVSPAFRDNRIYQFFSDGHIVCLSADTGKELWAKKVVKAFDAADQTRRTPLIDGGLVYAIDDNFAIQAIDAATGEVKSVYNIIKAHDFIVPDGRSIVIAGTDQVVSLDRVTGAILWKRDIAYKPLSSVFAADGYLFAVSSYKHAPFGIDFFARMKGRIDAFRLKDGEPVWGAKLKSGVTANASTSEYRVALLTNKGILSVYKRE